MRARRLLRKARISAFRSGLAHDSTVGSPRTRWEALSVPGTAVTPAPALDAVHWNRAPEQQASRDPGDHPDQLLHDLAGQLGDLHRTAEHPRRPGPEPLRPVLGPGRLHPRV